MPACTVTSRAVVGSSAISSCGPQASALAMAMRWRIPPENWCGKLDSTCSGSGRRTVLSSSIGPVAGLCRRQPEVDLDVLGQLASDAEHRVQRRHRVLEHDGDLVAAHPPQP